MTQTAALLDADLTPYFDASASEITAAPSRPLQWFSDAAVTIAMIVLAPILFIPVALAFAVACIRMQRFDRRAEGRGEQRYYRSPRQGLSTPSLSKPSVRTFHGDGLTVSSYRWN
jgi:hypothetical protein